MSSSEIKVQVLRQTLSTKRRHYLDWSHNFDKTRRCVTSQKNCHGFSGTFGSWSVGYKVCGTFWSASSLYPIWNLVTYWLVELLPWSSKPERLAGLSVGQKEKKINIKSQKIKQLSKRTVEHNICIMPFVYHIAKTGSWNVQIASCSCVHPLQSVCTYFCTQSCKGRIASYFFNIARKKRFVRLNVWDLASLREMWPKFQRGVIIIRLRDLREILAKFRERN